MTSVGQPKEFRRLTHFCFVRKIGGNLRPPAGELDPWTADEL